MMRGVSALIVAAVPLAACHVYQTGEVANPNAITLPDAFASVAAGLKSFQAGLNADPPLHLGVITCRIIVSFGLSATASANSSGTATLSAPIKVVSIGIGAEQDVASAGSRANTVTVELNSTNPQICAYYNSSTTYAYSNGAVSPPSNGSPAHRP